MTLKGGRASFCHKHLKEVTFGGFYGTRNEIEIALFVLRSAVVLEKMIISSSFKLHNLVVETKYQYPDPLGEKEREMFNRALQGQAVSSSAKLIIERPPSVI